MNKCILVKDKNLKEGILAPAEKAEQLGVQKK
jgi:hypothetical protein